MARALWAGLDVGVETTSVCVVDEAGEVLHEATCPTNIKGLHRELVFLKRRKAASVALESGASLFLARGLRTLGYKIDIYESRQLSGFLRVRHRCRRRQWNSASRPHWRLPCVESPLEEPRVPIHFCPTSNPSTFDQGAHSRSQSAVPAT